MNWSYIVNVYYFRLKDNQNAEIIKETTRKTKAEKEQLNNVITRLQASKVYFKHGFETDQYPLD